MWLVCQEKSIRYECDYTTPIMVFESHSEAQRFVDQEILTEQSIFNEDELPDWTEYPQYGPWIQYSHDPLIVRRQWIHSDTTNEWTIQPIDVVMEERN